MPKVIATFEVDNEQDFWNMVYPLGFYTTDYSGPQPIEVVVED